MTTTAKTALYIPTWNFFVHDISIYKCPNAKCTEFTVLLRDHFRDTLIYDYTALLLFRNRLIREMEVLDKKYPRTKPMFLDFDRNLMRFVAYANEARKGTIAIISYKRINNIFDHTTNNLIAR